MEYYQIGGIILGAFSVCALCTLILLPQLKKLKAGQSIREEGPQSHMAKSEHRPWAALPFFAELQWRLLRELDLIEI